MKNISQFACSIEDIAMHWNCVYGKNGHSGIKAKHIRDCKTYDEVDKLIGNTSWTQDYCGSCDKRKLKSELLLIGSHQVVVICKDCLKEAVKIYCK